MQLWRRLIGGMALIAGGLWLAADSGFISVPKYISEGLWAAFVILGTIGIQMFLGPSTTLAEVVFGLFGAFRHNAGIGRVAVATGGQGWLGGLPASWVEAVGRRLFFFRPA